MTYTNILFFINEITPKNLFKLFWINLGRVIQKFLYYLPVILSYVPLIISMMISLIIFFPNCFDRVPVLTYFIEKLELPITYELCGEVKIIDKNGNIVDKNVEVIVGGYKTSILGSTEFNLKFTSPMTNEVFVVIRYENNRKKHVFTNCLINNDEDSDHVFNEEFIIYE